MSKHLYNSYVKIAFESLRYLTEDLAHPLAHRIR